LCDRHSIYLIEDNAQAPLATQGFHLTGTVGDIGVFSLNYHKHIHTGEGGVCVTNDELLAIRLQAIRNHAENIVEPCGLSPVNMIGFNFRMTEMSAAVGLAQLDKIDAAVERRKVLAEKLSEAVSMHDGIEAPVCLPNCSHVYYIWAARIKEDELGISRESFSKALAAEGFPHFLGYVRPLYYLPTFQSRQAIGSEGWPFTLSTQKYIPGMCPVAESLFTNELLCFETCAYELGPDEIEMLIEAINKVYSNRSHILE
jgi:dTDP-4-amino-4,6-dideoxygalactose transaminase